MIHFGVCVGPGDSYAVWFDLLWQHDLAPGHYQATIGVRTATGTREVQARVGPLTFAVLPLAEADARLWAEGAAARQLCPDDPYDWLLRLDGARLRDTSFEAVAATIRLHRLVSRPELPIVGDPQGLAKAWPTWSRHPVVRTAGPLRERWQLVDEVIGPWSGAMGAAGETAALLQGSLRRLARSPDQGYVDALLTHLAAQVTRPEELPGQGYAAFQRRLDEWGHPWYAKPPEERPVW